MFKYYTDYFKVWFIWKLFFLKTKWISKLFDQTLAKRINPDLEYTLGMFLRYVQISDVYLSNSSKGKISMALSTFRTESYDRNVQKILLPFPIVFTRFLKESGKGFTLFVRTNITDEISFSMINKLNRQKHPYISYIKYCILAVKEHLMLKILLSLTKEQFKLLYNSQVKANKFIAQKDFGGKEAMDGWFNNELSHYLAYDEAFNKRDQKKYTHD